MTASREQSNCFSAVRFCNNTRQKLDNNNNEIRPFFCTHSIPSNHGLQARFRGLNTMHSPALVAGSPQPPPT